DSRTKPKSATTSSSASRCSELVSYTNKRRRSLWWRAIRWFKRILTGATRTMRTLSIGDVAITSIVERDGPWRTPEVMFPDYDPEIGRKHISELDSVTFDHASGKMVIPYQTFVVRTPKHTVLVDTCTGEDKGYPPPMDFPKQPWLDNFKAAGL